MLFNYFMFDGKLLGSTKKSKNVSILLFDLVVFKGLLKYISYQIKIHMYQFLQTDLLKYFFEGSVQK